MAVATLSPVPVQRYCDGNGAPLVGGKFFTYAAGTSTPLAAYTDSTLSTPLPNPIILNARGEIATTSGSSSGLWMAANVAYKLVLQDSLGNQIFSVDNVVNSQLQTLYGGVDTGAVNAYILNFTANFSSLVDGTIIYWTPANNNTGASTLTVNSLSPVNIKNQDGSTLLANQLIANQQAAVIIKGGVAYLLYTACGTPLVFPKMDVQARGVAICKYKPANTSRDTSNTGATIINDPDLAYTFPVAGTYRVECYLNPYQTTTGSIGIQGNLNYTGTITNPASMLLIAGIGGAGSITEAQYSFAASVSTAIFSMSPLSQVAGIGYIRMTGMITVSTVGTLTLAWGQNTGSANSTIVSAGSYLTVTQLS